MKRQTKGSCPAGLSLKPIWQAVMATKYTLIVEEAFPLSADSCRKHSRWTTEHWKGMACLKSHHSSKSHHLRLPNCISAKFAPPPAGGESTLCIGGSLGTEDLHPCSTHSVHVSPKGTGAWCCFTWLSPELTCATAVSDSRPGGWYTLPQWSCLFLLRHGDLGEIAENALVQKNTAQSSKRFMWAWASLRPFTALPNMAAPHTDRDASIVMVTLDSIALSGTPDTRAIESLHGGRATMHIGVIFTLRQRWRRGQRRNAATQHWKSLIIRSPKCTTDVAMWCHWSFPSWSRQGDSHSETPSDVRKRTYYH